MHKRSLTVARLRRREFVAARLVLLLPLLAFVGGCANGGLFGDYNKETEPVRDIPADRLYNEGVYLLNEKHDPKEAAKKFEELRNSGLQPAACINTMRAQNVTLKELLPGFTVAERGGVVRLAELQSQGYAYLRP